MMRPTHQCEFGVLDNDDGDTAGVEIRRARANDAPCAATHGFINMLVGVAIVGFERDKKLRFLSLTRIKTKAIENLAGRLPVELPARGFEYVVEAYHEHRV